MADTMAAAQRLALLQWHITRADTQRNGLWARAGALLSANALVMTGIAVLAASVGEGQLWLLAPVVLPLAASMVSIHQASTVLAFVRSWVVPHQPGRPGEALLYSLPETVHRVGSLDAFEPVVRDRTLDDELAGAVLELWRLAVLHDRRINRLRIAMTWFLASVPLFVAWAGLVILELTRH